MKNNKKNKSKGRVPETKTANMTKKNDAKLMAEIKKYVNKFKSIFVISHQCVKKSTLQNIEDHWRYHGGRFYYGPRIMLLVAEIFGKTVKTELKENLHLVSNSLLENNRALLFSNSSYLVVKSYFSNFVKNGSLREGDVAVDTCVIPKGTPLNPPSFKCFIDELGFPINNTTIPTLKQPFTLCNKGDVLTRVQAETLKYINEKAVTVKFRWSKDGSCEEMESDPMSSVKKKKKKGKKMTDQKKEADEGNCSTTVDVDNDDKDNSGSSGSSMKIEDINIDKKKDDSREPDVLLENSCKILSQKRSRSPDVLMEDVMVIDKSDAMQGDCFGKRKKVEENLNSYVSGNSCSQMDDRDVDVIKINDDTECDITEGQDISGITNHCPKNTELESTENDSVHAHAPNVDGNFNSDFTEDACARANGERSSSPDVIEVIDVESDHEINGEEVSCIQSSVEKDTEVSSNEKKCNFDATDISCSQVKNDNCNSVQVE